MKRARRGARVDGDARCVAALAAWCEPHVGPAEWLLALVRACRAHARTRVVSRAPARAVDTAQLGEFTRHFFGDVRLDLGAARDAGVVVGDERWVAEPLPTVRELYAGAYQHPHTAMRFAAYPAFRAHQDEVFLRKRCPPRARAWFICARAWVNASPRAPDVEAAAPIEASDALSRPATAPATIAASEDEACVRTACAICFETIDVAWCRHAECFQWVNATRGERGALVHATCAEALASSTA